MRGSDQQFLLSPHATINRLTYIKKNKKPLCMHIYLEISLWNFDKTDSHLLQTQDAHGVCVAAFFFFCRSSSDVDGSLTVPY